MPQKPSYDELMKRVLALEAEAEDSKALAERLRESEMRYRTLFDNNYCAILLIDPENGAIVDANPAACKFYGYSINRLLKMKISDINTLSKNEIFEEMRRAGKEERNYFNFRHRLAYGNIRDVEVYSGPIQMGGRTLLCSVIHDISSRKRAEQEREDLITALTKALSEVKTLQGFLPICASCKKIRDDTGYWRQIEAYIRDHSQAEFSHGLCPECAKELYPTLK